MGQLDTSIVSLVLPALEEQFNTSLHNVQWVAIIYLLVLTGLLTPLGRMADEFGRKALYTGGFIAFRGGEGGGGVARDLPMLVGARAVQALGGAMLQANSVALITAAVPRDKLGRAIGVQATAQALGLAYELTKVTDIAQITSFGAMSTPALVVDGKVKVTGKVISAEAIKTLLAEC